MTSFRSSGLPLLGSFAACLSIAAAATAAGPAPAPAPPPPTLGGSPTTLVSAQTTGELGQSLTREAQAAVRRSLEWLASQQKPDGSWSSGDYPALTALPLWAFSQSEYPGRDAIMARATKFILSFVQDSGAIYKPAGDKEGGLSGYNTALCMVALHLTGDPALTPVVQKARKFVAASQHLGDDLYRGGMGYDKASGRAYADLSNSMMAYEAMRMTQSAEDLRPAAGARADMNWQAATQFLGRVQNKPDSGTNDAGGFYYRPGESKAGATTNAAGAVVFRSYGSMTYAGLLSLVYADVSRDDPRVRSAFDWAAKHWTLDENPGAGTDGLFYFYNVLTKALSAYGQVSIPTPSGPRDWRADIVRKLLTLQKIDPKTGQGYWMNASGRWWEADPVLVTAYSVIALQVALGK